jgi:hypothetical protein
MGHQDAEALQKLKIKVEKDQIIRSIPPVYDVCPIANA